MESKILGAIATTSPSPRLSRRGFLRQSALAGVTFFTAPLFKTASAWAAASKVTVSCKNTLGDAAQISDFLGAGGGLYYVSTNPDDPVVQAWRNLGFRQITFETLHVEEPGDHWITVSRNAGGGLEIDFTDYDKYIRSYLDNLGATPYVYLGNMPRALSLYPEKDNYSVYMPRDLNEWQNFVADIVRHNIEKFGLRGINYGCPGEPDHPDTWLGSDSDEIPQRLREHIELYAATYRGVKMVDPTAKIGGPATMNWQETKYTGNPPFVLANWIRELANYNAEVGSERAVGLDYISWQDYAWSSERLADGAEAVAQFLADNGFDPNTPKMLSGSGWGSWSTDYLEASIPPSRRASQIAHSLIHEFKDPRQRKFYQALYYTFYFNEYWIAPGSGADETLRLIALVVLLKDGSTQLTPLYAAFQMASAMTSGEIVETAAANELEAMAVRDDRRQRVIATVNNHTAQKKYVEVEFREVPFASRRVRFGVQLIDARHSDKGLGLEKPRWTGPMLMSRRPKIQVGLEPYATAQITLAAG